jgi:preprotein translocase subunit SecF
MLAITPMMFLGGPVIETFAIAMVCGIVFGTYSTIYVASPMILILEDLRPWLGRFVALPGADAPQAPGEPGEEAALTESERRRRDRAEAERRLKSDDVVR